MLAGCAPEPDDAPATSSGTAAATDQATAVPSDAETAAEGDVPTPEPLPTGTATTSTTIPADCRSLLTQPILDALAGTPLNADLAGFPETLPAGSLVCVWGSPDAATTRMSTTISIRPHNDMIDYLNALADEGFNCYSPDAGVRCELTWRNPVYPVTDGRTLYFRDNILIDTQYSNLAPAGYTNAIVAALWPTAPAA